MNREEIEEGNPVAYRADAGNHAEATSYEDFIQNESILIKERTLQRIRNAARDRSYSNLTGHSNASSDSEDEMPAADHYLLTSPVMRAHNKQVPLPPTFAQLDLPSSLGHVVGVEGVPKPPEEDDDSESATSNTQPSTGNDVRRELFEAIPEPYYHSTEFSRVVITDTNEPVDIDTKEAAKQLKNCMDIREKWIAKHPYPSQDVASGFEALASVASMGQFNSLSPKSPNRKMSEGSASHRPEYRRRSVPPYEVFDLPLPSTEENIRFKFVDGIVFVQRLPPPSKPSTPSGIERKEAPPLVHQNSTDSILGMYVSESLDEAQSPGQTPVKQRISPSPSGTSLYFIGQDNSNCEGTCQQIDWTNSIFPVFTYQEFVQDFTAVRKAIYSGPVMSYSYRRLELLSAKFNLHCLLNDTKELEAQKSVPHRDFYNVRKVDTHVHHSACMNQKHLLRFIKHKLKRYPNEAVIFRDGRFLTLGEVFKSLNLTAYDLSIDTLDMHANNTFHRFDRFNLKYNPAGQSRLREIFLKTDNVISGRYLAEITKEVMCDLQASKYQLVEWRISIYGRKASEWSALARWFYVNRLAHPNVRWLIQIPRLYDVYRRGGEIQSFGDMLSNIFAPLFAVSLDPSSNPPLHYFLQTVVGIDSVDDESKPELEHFSSTCPTPENWTSSYNPPYAYWMYYMYSNICVLNQLRASRGLCTFQFRPHCGEAGDLDHLISTYLTAHQINHGKFISFHKICEVFVLITVYICSSSRYLIA